MGLFYQFVEVTLGVKYREVHPDAVASIVGGAFNPEGVAGGVLGALIIGFKRAAFSNEAGLGSAPIAHSAVKTRHPADWGEARAGEDIGGVTITSDAFETVLPWCPYILPTA